MTSVSQVQLGEDPGHMEGCKHGVKKWEKVPVVGSDVVQALIVDAGTQGPVLLLDKKESCSSCRG